MVAFSISLFNVRSTFIVVSKSFYIVIKIGAIICHINIYKCLPFE